MREVSRAHSTKRKPFTRNPNLKEPYGKEQIQCNRLDPNYVVGFIDGEGSFSVSINNHKTLKSRIEVKAEFEIELRADDREILERIMETIGCGTIYDCSYERYGWFPHVKYKIGSTKEMEKYLFPLLDAYPLQAKKAKDYLLFKEAVMIFNRKEHLTEKGFAKIIALRNRIRETGKKHYNGNR